jgi:hypothetical protein
MNSKMWWINRGKQVRIHCVKNVEYQVNIKRQPILL